MTMVDQLIWNAGAGKANQVEELRLAVAEWHIDWSQLGENVDLVHLIKRAVADGCQRVIAAGGDGTVNAVVNALMQITAAKRPSMGIVPLGTANDFAGTLAIPNEIIGSVELIHHASPIPIDVVRVRGQRFERFFANVAAGGNCVRVSEEMTDEIKADWGAFSYLRGAVTVLADLETFQIEVEVDGQRLSDIACWAVLVSNGRTNAGRIEVAPLALPNDGLLDVIIIKDGSVLDMVEIVAGNLMGQFLECEQVMFYQARKLSIRSHPRMKFTLDGEIVDEEPVEFEVVPGAIQMFTGLDPA